MSRKPTGRTRPARTAALVSLGVLAVGSLTACNSDLDGGKALGNPFDEDTTAAPATPQVQVAANVKARKPVAVDKVVRLTADQGELTDVVVRAVKGRKLPGELAQDGTSWKASSLLEPGTRYRIKATAQDADGLTKQFTRTFRTDDLTLKEQTYPTLLPLQGDTVGIAMPVVLRFDLPVQNKKAFERHLSVETSPVQQGTWHWVSDYEVRYRPKTYWKPGTEVKVDAAVNSINAGNGIYGQEDRSTSFKIGSPTVMKVNLQTHQMKVFHDGKLLRTIPVTGGKPGFTTRSGIKVIVEKFTSKRMNSATTGIDPGNPEFYDLSDVRYAQRVTFTGEFLHAAPWSVGSQGYANVSHGCVGMSTSNAEWLFNLTKVGDPVEVTGTDRPMTADNGYGDWNVPWREYKQGSALG